MKIKKISISNSKSLHLNSTKNKIYSEKKSLKNNEHLVKKVLNIIYKYQVNKKKILFLGFPEFFVQKLKQLPGMNKHTFIQEFFWINGVLTNQIPVFKCLFQSKHLNKNPSLKHLFNLKIQHSLIIVLSRKVDQNALIEGYNMRIPMIFLDNILNTSHDKFLYKVPINLEFLKKKIKSNFLLSVMFSIFKKASCLNKNVL